MNFKIVTLGCKVNQYESQALAAMLKKAGMSPVQPGQEADIFILNSCTVTATSDQKVRQTLRRETRKNPGAVVVLTGCMAQAFPEKSAQLEEADIVLGTSNRARLVPHLLSFLSARQRIVDITPHAEGETFEAMEIDEFSGRTRAYIKIQDGCNRFCSYCIIPYARGRVRSKPLADLQREVAALAANGYREVVLTGINLSTYGQDMGASLCDAIEAAAAPAGIDRVRLGSLEPEQLSPHIIGRMARIKKLCPQFHLSLQSGCDATLQRMNRHYTTAEYREIVQGLRAAFNNPAITTDLMVGFPGETEEEFLQSLSFAEEIGFAQTHVFAYSRRPGTKAFDLTGQLTEKIKEGRSARMISVADKGRKHYHQSLVGTTQQVLFETKHKPGLYLGHTPGGAQVLAPAGKNLCGALLPVSITQADDHCCYAAPQSAVD